jgi:hypothetical protein
LKRSWLSIPFIILAAVAVILTLPLGGESTACAPSDNSGHLGVCVERSPQPKSTKPALTKASRGYIHDLYEGNYDNCAAPLGRAKIYLTGVIVKAFEYRADRCFARYWRELAALHEWHAAYLFAHGGCSQTAGYVATVRAAGGWDAAAGPPVIDAEVPDAYGAVACLAPRIHQLTGIWPLVTYTAPGTWPGGGTASTLLWVADYGSHPGCVWTCHIVAWQYTDGSSGPQPHSIGPFHGDLSLDYGLTALLAHPAPPPPPPCCRIGDRGPQVWAFLHDMTIAHWFARHGDYYSPHAALVVAAFQRKHHLAPVTGIAGPRTRATAHLAAAYAKAHPSDHNPI